jgi:hypothetical protein
MVDKVGLKVREGAGVAKVSADQAPTASETIVASANKTAEVIDVRTRVLVVKRLGALDRMRLFAAAGAELAANDRWMGMAAIACSVVKIDADLVPKPGTRREIEALVDLLDDEGLEAVGSAYAEFFGIGAADDLADKAKN